MNTLHVKHADTGAILATIDQFIADNGSEYLEARILSTDRARQFQIEPLSIAVAYHRIQRWIDSQLGGE